VPEHFGAVLDELLGKRHVTHVQCLIDLASQFRLLAGPVLDLSDLRVDPGRLRTLARHPLHSPEDATQMRLGQLRVDPGGAEASLLAHLGLG
jgi:hypothetical protein